MPGSDLPESVHMIGIGGIGMSALARLLADRGVRVTGSDTRESALTSELRAAGIPVAIGHSRDNVADAAAIGYSTAIKSDNPEVQRATELGLAIYHRSELLGQLLADRETVAVSGTHGKTTTSALLASILVNAGLDPLVMVGGEAPDLGGNARSGRGAHAVVEADESDRSFLNLSPTHAIVTNIEADHLDQYSALDDILECFGAFLAGLPEEGFTLLCADCRNAIGLAHKVRRPITYGLEIDADYIARDIVIDEAGTRYRMTGRGGVDAAVRVPFPGRHYAANSLATLAASLELGLDLDRAIEAVAAFRGTARRFERLGTFCGAELIDDYAHHPTEVRCTIQAAKKVADGRVIAVFQPHMYSRTRLLLDEFAVAFEGADVVILTDIYPAREDPATATISGMDLVDRVRANMNGTPVKYVDDLGDLPDALRQVLAPNDLLLMMGAGDIRLTSESMARGGTPGR